MKRLRFQSGLGLSVVFLVLASVGYGIWWLFVSVLADRFIGGWTGFCVGTALSIFLFLLLLLAGAQRKDEEAQHAANFFLFVFLLIDITVSIYRYASEIFYVISSSISSFLISYRLIVPFTIAAWIISVFIAYALFKLRKMNRTLYGHVEIIFGVISIVFSIIQSNLDVMRLGIPFFAGIYIIVRGLTNLEEGLAPKVVNLKSYFISLRDLLISAVLVEVDNQDHTAPIGAASSAEPQSAAAQSDMSIRE